MMCHNGDQREFFNERAEQWLDMWYRDPETGKLTRHEAAFLRFFTMLDLKEGNAVLDVGCGSGVLAPYILDHIGANGTLHEVDYAEKMIEVNRRLHEDERIRFTVADASSMSLDSEHYDVVICFSCFPHFQNKPQTMVNLTQALKPGGKFVVSHFDSSHDLNHHHRQTKEVMHDRLPTGDEMKTLFGDAGLQVETFIDEKGYYYIEGRK